MTKLSNVVGGLLQDLARSHSISDASSLDILDAYGRDPVLAQLPVPRLSIREAQLTLRFAVSAIQEEEKPLDPEEVRDLWIDALRSKVVPRALAEVGRIDNKRVVAAFDRVVAKGSLEAELDPQVVLGTGREQDLIALSQKFLLEQVETIPTSTRRSFEKLDVDGALDHALRDEIPDLIAAVRQLEQARKAAAADLNVSITTDALAEVPDGQLSQLTLTVSMEELQRGAVPDREGGLRWRSSSTPWLPSRSGRRSATSSPRWSTPRRGRHEPRSSSSTTSASCPPPAGGGAPALRTVEFTYRKRDENEEEATFEVSLPLLGMVDIPLIAIRRATINLEFEVSSVEESTTPTPARPTLPTLSGRTLPVFKGNVLSGRRPPDERGSIKISVEVEKAELPPGLARSLDILEVAATERKTPGP